MIKKKFWIFTDIHECPVCGGGNTYRTRRYTRKPKDRGKRMQWHPSYDWCMERDYGF